ncbi:MAG: ferredoxin--nitrite reductase [Epsilonproteobacteria bacterium]|nr:ferredoxin--nitrite reductase [Campylobacterota bacterium]
MLELLEKVKANRSKKLNKIEKIKSTISFSEAKERLFEGAKRGYDYLKDEDKAVFLKYFGLFDKNKFTPKRFMLRVRVLGGKVSAKQAEVLGKISKEFCNDSLDLTTRMQVELRNIRIEDIPEIFKRLDEVGLSSMQTGIDNLRNIVTDPLDGVGMDNLIESFPIIKEMERFFLDKEEWIGVLPRKFNSGVCGSIANRTNIYGQDAAFVLAQKDGIFGFNVYLGGKVGKVAKSMDIFLKPNEVVSFFKNLIELYRDFGFRDNRNKNRLYFLIEEIGVKNFRDILEEINQKSFEKEGIVLTKIDYFDNNFGKVLLKDGTFAHHLTIKGGIFSGSDLIEAAKIVKDNGGDIRFSIEQNLYLTSLKEEQIDSYLFKKYSSLVYFNNLVACAGSNECAFGVIPNKSDAIEMGEFLEKEVKLPNDAKVRFHWSGCVKGCGIHEWGDIGFVGVKSKKDSKTFLGVDIFLGGSFKDSKEANSLLKGVILEEAKYLIKELMVEYKLNRKENESFEEFNKRYFQKFSKGAIAFLMKFNYFLKKLNIDYRFSLNNFKDMAKIEEFEIFTFGNEIYYKLTSTKAYLDIYNFMPVGSTKPQPLIKITPTIPKNLSDLIYKMVHPNEKERFKVFSEILPLID